MKMHNHTRPFSLSGYVHTRPFSLSRRVKKVISSSGRRPTHDEEGRTSKAGGVQVMHCLHKESAYCEAFY